MWCEAHFELGTRACARRTMHHRALACAGQYTSAGACFVCRAQKTICCTACEQNTVIRAQAVDANPTRDTIVAPLPGVRGSRRSDRFSGMLQNEHLVDLLDNV